MAIFHSYVSLPEGNYKLLPNSWDEPPPMSPASCGQCAGTKIVSPGSRITSTARQPTGAEARNSGRGRKMPRDVAGMGERVVVYMDYRWIMDLYNFMYVYIIIDYGWYMDCMSGFYIWIRVYNMYINIIYIGSKKDPDVARISLVRSSGLCIYIYIPIHPSSKG